MVRMIPALAVVGLMTFSVQAFSADEPHTAQPKVQKPGRAADDTVKTVKTDKQPGTKPGRAIEDAVKSGEVDDKPQRAVDKQESTKKKKAKQPKS